MPERFDLERKMHQAAFRLVGGPHHGPVLLSDAEAALLRAYDAGQTAALEEAAERFEDLDGGTWEPSIAKRLRNLAREKGEGHG